MTALYDRHGRGSAGDDPELCAQLADFGAPPELLQRLERQAAERPPIEVWPENACVIELMRSLDSQWRVVERRRRLLVLGLDYTAAEAVARMLRIEMTPRLFRDLRHCEAVAAPLLQRLGG